MISIDKIGIYINLNAAAVTSGAYIGYCEGKGIDTSTTVEYLTKIGPTGFSIFSTPLGIKANQSFREFVYHKLNNGTVKENPIQIEKTKKDLEEKLKEDPRYMKSMLVNGTKTGLYTATGYIVGRVFSHFY